LGWSFLVDWFGNGLVSSLVTFLDVDGIGLIGYGEGCFVGLFCVGEGCDGLVQVGTIEVAVGMEESVFACYGGFAWAFVIGLDQDGA